MGVLILVVVGATVGYAWYLSREIHRIDVRGLSDVPSTGADAGTENILMVGSTTRCALKVQNPAYGLCSQGVTGVNSDVVMILHLNSATHAVSLLSIPRDLFVPNARQEGANKIDAALYEGPTQLVDAIQEDFGIPIQHYIELNFDTFAGVVDALGAIKMYFPEPVYDAYSGFNIPVPGCVALNGFQALQVVRARHLQYKGPRRHHVQRRRTGPRSPQSDLARIRRDHEFLRVLATAVAKQGIGNPFTDSQIIASVAPQLEVDSGLSANRDGQPGAGLPRRQRRHGAPADHAGRGGPIGSYIYKGGNYGDIELPRPAQDQQVVDQFLGVAPITNTMTGRRCLLQRPSRFRS